jgi:hypothetical protein
MRSIRWFNKSSRSAEFEIVRVDPDLVRQYTHLFNFLLMHQDKRPKGTWWFGLKSRGFFARPDESVLVVDFDLRETSPDKIARELAHLGIEVRARH